jgi:hypothetical protein
VHACGPHTAHRDTLKAGHLVRLRPRLEGVAAAGEHDPAAAGPSAARGGSSRPAAGSKAGGCVQSS